MAARFDNFNRFLTPCRQNRKEHFSLQYYHENAANRSFYLKENQEIQTNQNEQIDQMSSPYAIENNPEICNNLVLPEPPQTSSEIQRAKRIEELFVGSLQEINNQENDKYLPGSPISQNLDRYQRIDSLFQNSIIKQHQVSKSTQLEKPIENLSGHYSKYQANFQSKYSKFIKSRQIQSNSIIQLINKREQQKKFHQYMPQNFIRIEPLTPLRCNRIDRSFQFNNSNDENRPAFQNGKNTGCENNPGHVSIISKRKKIDILTLQQNKGHIFKQDSSNLFSPLNESPRIQQNLNCRQMKAFNSYIDQRESNSVFKELDKIKEFNQKTYYLSKPPHIFSKSPMNSNQTSHENKNINYLFRHQRQNESPKHFSFHPSEGNQLEETHIGSGVPQPANTQQNNKNFYIKLKSNRPISLAEFY